MRFRYLFPVLELALSIALVFIPVLRCLPYYRLRGSDGREVASVEGPPFDACMANSEEFATGVNLPATLVVQPILFLTWEYSDDQHDWLHDTLWRSVGFTIVGVLVWFFVGRFFDDMTEWHRAKAWPSSHVSDLLFAIVTAVLATLALAQLRDSMPWMSWLFVLSSIFWFFIGYLSLAARIIQIMQRRK